LPPRGRRSTFELRDPLKKDLPTKALDPLGATSIGYFWVVWASLMYFSGYGPTSPIQDVGKVYPIVVHGRTVYVSGLWSYIDSPTSQLIMICVMAANLLLRRFTFMGQSTLNAPIDRT
jgi:hypothetical protein